MSRILRLTGLPFKISKETVKDWILELCQVSADEVHLIANRKGLATGDAYVVFADKSQAKSVQESCDEKTIGDSNRYVKIHESDETELEWQLKRQELFKGDKEKSSDLYCVRMYGLPFRVNDYEVAKWFNDVSAHCVDVQFHLNHHGKKSGDATAFFTSQEEALKATSKDKQDMGGRYINLSMDTVVAMFDSCSLSTTSEFCLKMSGLPFRASQQEMKDFFLPQAKCIDVKVILNKDGRPSGDAIASFQSQEELEAALTKDREHMGSRFVILSRLDTNDENGIEKGSSGGNVSIKLSGLPFRTREPEIIDWFSPHATCTKVRILRSSRDGRPSGEAIATFANQEDANEAMKMNKEYLGERFVILTMLH